MWGQVGTGDVCLVYVGSGGNRSCVSGLCGVRWEQDMYVWSMWVQVGTGHVCLVYVESGGRTGHVCGVRWENRSCVGSGGNRYVCLVYEGSFGNRSGLCGVRWEQVMCKLMYCTTTPLRERVLDCEDV